MFRDSEEFKILRFFERGMQFEADASGSGGDDNIHDDGPAGSPQGGELHSEGEPLPEDFLKTISEKKPEELHRTIYNLEKKLGQQGNELGQLRKEKPVTSDTLKAEQKKLLAESKELEKKLKELDADLDSEDYEKLSKQKEKLHENLSELSEKISDVKMSEKINSAFDEKNNDILLAKTRKDYEESCGMKFSNSEWKNIEQTARKFGDGLLKDGDIDAAIMKEVGPEKYRATMSLQGEMKARQDMAAAIGKITTSIGGDSKYSDSKIANVDKLTYAEKAQVLESLSAAQIDEILIKKGIQIK